MNEKQRGQYHDILLTVLMERYMEEDGTLLQEDAAQLNADPDFCPPEDALEQNLAALKKGFRAAVRKRRRVNFVKASQKVAVALLVCGFALSFLYYSVEAFRVTVNNMFIDAQETYLTLTSGSQHTEFEEGTLVPTWYPEGFTENVFSYDPTNVVIQYLTSEKEDAHITYYTLPYGPEGSAQTKVGTEGAESIVHKEFCGYESIQVTGPDYFTIVWTDTDKYVRCVISSKYVDPEIVLQLAESIYH